MSITIVVFIVIAVLFDFLNGFHDSANIVSTMISSRALSPRQALAITALCEFVGPFLFGVAVATTIGSEVLAMPPDPKDSIPLILAALIAAVGWNIFTWYIAIPSSSSHALIGGLLGAGLLDSALRQAAMGLSTMDDLYTVLRVVKLAGLMKIVTALLVSPVLGFAAGFFVLRLIRFLTRGATPAVNHLFKRGQVITAIGLALSHGTNDAQKTMGIITMGLLAMGIIPSFHVPIWVVALCAAAIAAGTATGGWRLIKTLGGKFYKIRPVHGLTTQISSAGVILGAALLGGPVSTTHVVSSAIMGTGSAERFSKVRWGVGKQIVLTWIVTIPATAVVAALVFCLVRRFL
jgi:PiT family inorganic phosphate transporter